MAPAFLGGDQGGSGIRGRVAPLARAVVGRDEVSRDRSQGTLVGERCTVKVTIVNRLGLHARPAMAFVDAASAFASTVKVSKADVVVDGKSIMEMMMLAAGQGTQLEITAEGPDADKACAALKKLVDAGFDEE